MPSQVSFDHGEIMPQACFLNGGGALLQSNSSPADDYHESQKDKLISAGTREQVPPPPARKDLYSRSFSTISDCTIFENLGWGDDIAPMSTMSTNEDQQKLKASSKYSSSSFADDDDDEASIETIDDLSDLMIREQ
jgi:hypothetical protein